MIARHLSTHRGYRETVAPDKGEVRFQVVVEQTDLMVVARRDMKDDISLYLNELRGELKNWIMFHPEFAASLEPVDAAGCHSALVRAMADAARVCGVGPMAGVAGAIAQAVADRFVADSPDILVENGGDVFMHSTRERVVALLPDPANEARLGLRFASDDFPVSICSSSATIGHSLSLGSGDLVAVRAASGALADCAATALCNRLKGARDLDEVLAQAKGLAAAGLQGVFAQIGPKVAAWGDVELVALES